MSKTNHAVADAQPERVSYTRITTGAPLSRHLKSDSDRVREMKEDLARGGMTIGQILTRMELLAVRLESRARVAKAIEEHCEQLMGAGHE